MKITDLMDDYYDEGMFLPATEQPTTARTRELTLNKLGIEKKTRRRVPVGALAAAACVVVFSITAGAVGYSLWDAAKEDAGLEADTRIPEYTEYSPETAPQTDSCLELVGEELVDGAKVELISTLCSDLNITAYLAISPVTQEMASITAEELQGLYDFGCWSFLPLHEKFSAWSERITMTSYDPQTQTALVCLKLYLSDPIEDLDEFPAAFFWQHERDGTVVEQKYYGLVTIPITLSEDLTFSADAVFTNNYLPGETAALTEVSLGADHIYCTYEAKSFQTLCQEYGKDAYFKIGDAYEGYHAEQIGSPRPARYTELSAEVYFHRSWHSSLEAQLQNAFLTLRNGTQVSLEGVHDEGTGFSLDTGITQAKYTLPAALDVRQVVSLTFNGKTYPVE